MSFSPSSSVARLEEELSALKSIYENEFDDLGMHHLRLNSDLSAYECYHYDQVNDDQISGNKVIDNNQCFRVVAYKDDTIMIELALNCGYLSEIAETNDSCINHVSILKLSFHGEMSKKICMSKSNMIENIELIIINNRNQETLFDIFEYIRSALESQALPDESDNIETVTENIESNHLESEISPMLYHENIILSNSNTIPSGNIMKANRKTTTEENNLTIIHGEIFSEKKSSFQSHLTFVKNMDEVNQFRNIIIEDKKYSKATHNIFAYRFECDVKNVLCHDYDDDGETAAGSRLAELLRYRTDLLINDLHHNITLLVTYYYSFLILLRLRSKKAKENNYSL